MVYRGVRVAAAAGVALAHGEIEVVIALAALAASPSRDPAGPK
jgi:hypothetical protein